MLSYSINAFIFDLILLYNSMLLINSKIIRVHIGVYVCVYFYLCTLLIQIKFYD